jgi:hypothetical protein
LISRLFPLVIQASGNLTFLNYLKRQVMMFKLSVVLKIFLVPQLLALSLILVAPIYISLDRLRRLVAYSAPDLLEQEIILFLLMLGILGSSISNT